MQGKRDSAWCKLLFDDGTEKECLGQDFKIGRHTSNNHHVENEGYLSSSHCYLTAPVRWGALPTLTDTSMNGTFVNGERLLKSSQELQWGERIEVVKGNKSLCFVLRARAKSEVITSILDKHNYMATHTTIWRHTRLWRSRRKTGRQRQWLQRGR